ncbi:TRAP transporter small permease subunit [Escherichia coli]|nr:TRAP transporter small permease subunit [Escherichia coli]EFO4242008.1 TRAP transporter small permease subunit [Escherichia coli]
MDLFALALNKRKQLLLSIVINILILGFAGSVIVTGGLKLIDKTLATSQVSAAMQIPMGYVYIILPLSGVVMMFYALCFINQSIQQLKQPAQEAS